MIDWNKPIRTKDGRLAKFIGMCDNQYYRRVVQVNLAGTINVYTYTEEGHFAGLEPRDIDLENVPEERFVWLNVYPDFVRGHTSRADADSYIDNSSLKDKNRISCQKVKIEPGRFDE